VGRRPQLVEDEESFAWFFAGEYPALVRSLCQMVPRPDAEDIAQDAFVRLHQRWAKISRYERPDCWLRRVAINLAMTQAKREGRRRARETRAQQLGAQTYEPADPDPAVAAAIRELAPREQALIVLFYYEDRPLAEVADIVGISLGAAKAAMHRARARLALTLGDERVSRHQQWEGGTA
jgi:RNA polymerase sigma-70 factor (ECF subfamily)